MSLGNVITDVMTNTNLVDKPYSVEEFFDMLIRHVTDSGPCESYDRNSVRELLENGKDPLVNGTKLKIMGSDSTRRMQIQQMQIREIYKTVGTS